MATSLIHFAAVVVFIIAGTNCQDMEKIQACTATMMNQIMSMGGDTQNPGMCPVIQDYAKCALESIPNIKIDESNIGMYESMLESSLAKQPGLQGLDCDLNLRGLIDGEGSNNNNNNNNNNGEAGYQPANGDSSSSFNTGDPCLDDYMNSAFKVTSTNEICPLAETLLRCELNRNPEKKMSESEIRTFEDKIGQQLKQAGVSCQIDIRGIVKEHNGDDGGNGAAAVFGPASLRNGVLLALASYVLMKLA